MKLLNIKSLTILLTLTLFFSSCSNDDDSVVNPIDPVGGPDFSGVFVQEDQIGRPGINTVFSADATLENAFNVTVPSEMVANFQQPFENRLAGLHSAFGVAYENNILGLDITTLTTVLAADVLQVAPDGPTTYFGGLEPENILTGRALTDDVIDISLILLFGGANGERFNGENGTPELVTDGVDSNDRDFLPSFPYLASPF